MKYIELTQNKIAIVDDNDYNFLSRLKWYANKNQSDNWYAIHTENKYKKSLFISPDFH